MDQLINSTRRLKDSGFVICYSVTSGEISLKKKYPNFVVNGTKQLSLMKGN